MTPHPSSLYIILADFSSRRAYNHEVKMTDAQQLLADYVKNGSEPAFRELVTRYFNLVYSTANRLVGGDAYLAEDVAQQVFLDLARRSSTLPKEVMLGGWLHRDTCFVASRAMRSQRRRQAREQQAALMNSLEDHSKANLAQVAPILDEAINQLGETDRTAILLRFFEQHDFHAIGEALGSSENAAQKRVSRALEELRILLQHRGVSLSAVTLGTVLAAEAVATAPVGMAASIAGTALAGAATGVGITSVLFNAMSVTKLKIGLMGAIVVTSATVPYVIQHQAVTKLRTENQSLTRQLVQSARLGAENERLSNLVAQARNTPSLPDEQLNELLRLRGEVGMLRRQTNELANLLKQTRQTQTNPTTIPPESEETEERNLVIAWARFGKYIGLALRSAAHENNGRFPNAMSGPLFTVVDALSSDTQYGIQASHFELLYTGSLNDLKEPGRTILARQKEPIKRSDGRWFRIYLTCDGAVQSIGAESRENFATREKELFPGEPNP